MKIEFQSVSTATESPDSVWTELTRRRVSSHLSTVRRRWPLLLAPTSPTSHHAPHGCLRRFLHSLRALLSSAFVLGELRRASASFPGHSTASLAKPARPELRLDVLYLDVHLFLLAEDW